MRPATLDRARIVRMYQGGLSPSDIATELGARLNAVKMNLRRAGVYQSRWAGPKGSPEAIAKTESQKASLAEHVAEGGTVSGWARHNGVAESWAWQLWRKIRADLGAQAI